MAAGELTVFETGPDGDSTYQLVVGRDIDPSDAQDLITRSGGTTVYAMHHYEAGNRVESFISQKMFDQIRGANAMIETKRRSIDDIRADIDRRLTPPAPAPSKPWWAFWR